MKSKFHHINQNSDLSEVAEFTLQELADNTNFSPEEFELALKWDAYYRKFISCQSLNSINHEQKTKNNDSILSDEE